MTCCYQILVVLLLFAPLCGQAQETSASQSIAQPGEKVRISAPRFIEGIVQGKLVDVQPDTVVVALAKDTARHLRVPRDKIIGVEVQRGQKRNWLVGGLIGAGAGAAIFAALGSGHSDESELVALIVAVAAGGGFVVGAGLGALSKSDRWQIAHLDSKASGSSNESSPGLHLNLSIHF